MARAPKEIDDAAVDREAVDLNERRHRRIGHGAEPNGQTRPLHGHRGKQIDAERLELDVAVEPFFEGGDDELAERLGAGAAAATTVSTTSVPTTAAATHAAVLSLMISVCTALGFRLAAQQTFDHVIKILR